MKQILVPTDFSPAARAASEYAASLAKTFNAAIYLLYVYREPAPAAEAPSAWMIIGSELQEENEARIQIEIHRLAEAYGIEVHGAAKVGYKGHTLQNTADEIRADLMVMGRKENKRLKILGSTALAMIRTKVAPVLIVPEGAVFSPIKHVALAVDFDEVTNASCFSPLFAIVEGFDADLHVLHVEKIGAGIEPSELPGKLQLGKVLSKVTYWYEKVENNDVESGIKKFIENHPVDLLAVVAHHHDIFERMFGIIHTRLLSYETRLPLLVLAD